MTRQPFSKRLRPFVALLLGIAIIPVVAAPSFAQGRGERKITQITQGKGERHTFELPPRVQPEVPARVQPEVTLPSGPPSPIYGGPPIVESFSFLRKYVVYLPKDYNPEETLPLVMVLHGCLEVGSSELALETIEHDSMFDVVADEKRFIVVYPNHGLATVPSLPFCWLWWIDSNIHEGSGEVADLVGIVEAVQSKYKVDLNRIHIAGLSSGAAMTVAALVAYSELFASGSPTAGLPYSETDEHVLNKPPAFKSVDEVAEAMNAEMGPHKWPVPIFIIQSRDDEAVNFHYAEIIRDSWGKAFGVDTGHPISSVSGKTKGTPWTHSKYGGPGGKTVVETLFLKGLRHGWYGDGKAQYAFPNAPDTARLVWEFFRTHPRPADAPH